MPPFQALPPKDPHPKPLPMAGIIDWASRSSFPLMHTPYPGRGGSRGWHKYWGPCHSSRVPRLSSWASGFDPAQLWLHGCLRSKPISLSAFQIKPNNPFLKKSLCPGRNPQVPRYLPPKLKAASRRHRTCRAHEPDACPVWCGLAGVISQGERERIVIPEECAPHLLGKARPGASL